MCCSYNPAKSNISSHLCIVGRSLDHCIDLILINFPKSFQRTQTTEAGLSDFHKLTLTVLKTHFPRLKPNIVNYRDYKGFVNDYFRSELLQEINSLDSDLTNFKGIQYTRQRVLDKHTPLKKRHVRDNQQNFMDKELNQTIMIRSKLRNKYLKSKSEIDKQRYNKQRTYCVKLLRLKK